MQFLTHDHSKKHKGNQNHRAVYAWFFFYLLSVFGKKKKIGVLLFEENKDNGLDRIMTLVLHFNLRGDSKTFSETWEGDQIRSKVTCDK